MYQRRYRKDKRMALRPNGGLPLRLAQTEYHPILKQQIHSKTMQLTVLLGAPGRIPNHGMMTAASNGYASSSQPLAPGRPAPGTTSLTVSLPTPGCPRMDLRPTLPREPSMGRSGYLGFEALITTAATACSWNMAHGSPLRRRHARPSFMLLEKWGRPLTGLPGTRTLLSP